MASKFDNRLKEFSERWEVDRYLSASGYLANGVKPFYVSLPKERKVSTSADFRQQIQEVGPLPCSAPLCLRWFPRRWITMQTDALQVDEAIFHHLREKITDGFDEDQYGSRIGFAQLRKWVVLFRHRPRRCTCFHEKQSPAE